MSEPCVWTPLSAEVVAAGMRFEEQSQASLEDSAFWLALCPFLSLACTAPEQVERDAQLASLSAAGPPVEGSSSIPYLGSQLNERGYFRLAAGEGGYMPAMGTLSERLALGARRLVAHGFNASFLMMYDEAWMVGGYITSFLEPSSGNAPIGDWYVFHVDDRVPGGYFPGPPHRDRPSAGPASFRHSAKGDAPMYCSVWFALTAATPDNSCLYVLPRGDDPGYEGPGDTHPGVGCLRDIVAQPLVPGGMLAFSHRCYHWGSKPQPVLPSGPAASGALPPEGAPRTALTLAFADPGFEAPYFDASHLPFPVQDLRLGLVMGQLTQYAHLAPLGTNLSMVRRVFHKHRAYFSDAYFDKISSAIQFMEYQRKGKLPAAAAPRKSTASSAPSVWQTGYMDETVPSLDGFFGSPYE